MVWTLAREQLRAQRRYVAWTGAVIAFTVGLAVYGLLFTLATVSATDNVSTMLGGDRQWVASGVITEQADPSPDYLRLSPEEFRAAVASAQQAGAQPFAVALSQSFLAPQDASATGGALPQLVGLDGDVDWPAILVDGNAPQAGQVVVSAEYADALGVTIGDPVAMVSLDWGEDGELLEPVPVGRTLIISGIAHSGVALGPLTISVPSGYANFDDLVAIDAALWRTWAQANPDVPNAPSFTSIEVAWNGTARAFEPYATANGAALGGFGAPEGKNTVLWVALVGVGALIVGTIAMAFAVGRAQAQARSKWVATARALGATRSTIIRATLAESVLLGLAAGVVGLVLGTVLAAGHALLVRMRAPHSVFDAGVSFDWRVAAAALVLGLLLALIVGAIPAFWSTRVTPVAALKPVSELTEAEVSRRVAVGPLVVTWVIATSVAILTTFFELPGLLFVLQVVAWVLMIVLTVVLLQEALRWAVPLTAHRLAASARRPVMVAGDIITARPRQTVIPAFIAALAVAAMVTIYVAMLAGNAVWWDYGDVAGTGRSTLSIAGELFPATVGVFAVITLVCVAIAVSSGTLTAREAATREALGVTRRDGQVGAGIAYAAGQALGIAAGVGLGALFGTWMALATTALDEGTHIAWMQGVVAPLCITLLLGCAVVALGAVIAAALTPIAAPIARFESVS